MPIADIVAEAEQSPTTEPVGARMRAAPWIDARIVAQSACVSRRDAAFAHALPFLGMASQPASSHLHAYIDLDRVIRRIGQFGWCGKSPRRELASKAFCDRRRRTHV